MPKFFIDCVRSAGDGPQRQVTRKGLQDMFWGRRRTVRNKGLLQLIHGHFITIVLAYDCSVNAWRGQSSPCILQPLPLGQIQTSRAIN